MNTVLRQLKRAATTIVHINQHVIKHNRANGLENPPITIKQPGSNTYAHEAVIVDENGREVARVVYRPNDPLSCGAHVWIETDLTVLAMRWPGDEQ